MLAVIQGQYTAPALFTWNLDRARATKAAVAER